MKVAYDIFGEELIRDLYNTLYNKFGPKIPFHIFRNRVSYMSALKRKKDIRGGRLHTWSVAYDMIDILDLPLKRMPLLVNHHNEHIREVVAWRLRIGK